MARRLITVLVILVAGLSLVATDSFAQTRQQIQRQQWQQWQRQQQQQRGGFFQRLFGPRPTYQNPPFSVFGPRPSVSKPRKKKTSSAAGQPPVATVEVAPKDEKARKVMVIGDFVAGGLAWGLDQAFANEPRLTILDESDAASGLVRTDQHDWNATLLDLLNREKPDAVIAVFGVNDRQQMRAGGSRLAVRSPGWEKAYSQRIDGITETLKVYGRPFFWVSAPPIRTSAGSGDMAYLNGLYKPRVEMAGGSFVDVWNGFTDADGQYIASGPDIDGQVRQLRTSDGVNFTRAGRLKLSFYLEKDVRKKTGVGAGGVDLLASTTQASQIEIGPDGKKRLVGPIISLSDPLPGDSANLAGAPPPTLYDPLTGATSPAPVEPAKPDDTLRYRLIVKGDPLPTVAGRADDFAWPTAPRPAAAAAPEPTADAAMPAVGSAEDGPALTPVSKSN